MQSRRHFSRFDDELHDSDQTISTPARTLQTRSRLSMVAGASNNSSDEGLKPPRRRFPTSAFFSDTTDDEMSRPISGPSDRYQLSMSAYNRSRSTTSNKMSLRMSTGSIEDKRRDGGMRLHVDAVQFPATRSVLWDRRRLSNVPVGVSLEQVLPQFTVSADALKEIHKLYQEKDGVRVNGAALCYLYGNATSPRMTKVLLEGIKLKKKDARAAGTWYVPVHLIADGNNPGLSQESYVSIIAAVQSNYRDEYSDNIVSKLQPKLLVFRSSPHAAQLDVQLECVASPMLFKFSLIRNLPLLMTPLAASLAKREFSAQSGNLRSGYLTLDRTRKAVPLLKVDPLVLQQPLVGVWIYGVQIDDDWDEEKARRQLAHPLLYFTCIGYLTSETIKERVGPEKNTFLVALYPASDRDGGAVVGSLPRFFECSFSEFLSPHTGLLPMELFSHRRSCLVGVSKFSTDVKLNLSAAPTSEWEAARRQAKLPTAPRSKENEDTAPDTAPATVDSTPPNCFLTSIDKLPYTGDDDEHKGLRNITAADAIHQTPVQSQKETSDAAITGGTGVAKIGEGTNDSYTAACTQATKAASHLSPSNKTEDVVQRDWNDGNSSSYRSCCKTQQLLTIQHQQILENQQRQLHEMQEQIVQLRRLLDAAESDNKKEVSAASNDKGSYDSDVSISNVSSTFSRYENGHSGSQSSIVSVKSQGNGDRSFSDKSSAHTRRKDENARERDQKDLSLSSLGLSSISCSSEADLSSLSSSVLGERSKEFGSSQSQKGTTVDDEQAESDMCQSQLSGFDTEAEVRNITDQDADIDIQKEELSMNVSDARGSLDNSAHGLSMDELSTASHQEGPRNADKASIALDDSDGDVNASGDDRSVVDRLLSPDAYLRKVGGFVDHHGGCFTTPPLDFHSFCVPRIKFSSEAPECDSDDEEIRLIEQKYKRLMAT